MEGCVGFATPAPTAQNFVLPGTPNGVPYINKIVEVL
jgi:hypothetical protein